MQEAVDKQQDGNDDGEPKGQDNPPHAVQMARVLDARDKVGGLNRLTARVRVVDGEGDDEADDRRADVGAPDRLWVDRPAIPERPVVWQLLGLDPIRRQCVAKEKYVAAQDVRLSLQKECESAETVIRSIDSLMRTIIHGMAITWTMYSRQAQCEGMAGSLKSG